MSPQALTAAAQPVIERILADAEAAPERLRPALRRFAERLLEERKTVNEIERLCGLFATELAQMFTQHFGIAPRIYLTERRLEIAAALLRSFPADAYRIGHVAGFPSPATFGAVFKARYGMTPAVYQRAEHPVGEPVPAERSVVHLLGELVRRDPEAKLERSEPETTEDIASAEPLHQDRSSSAKEPPMTAKPLTHHDLATLFATADTGESSPARRALLALASRAPFDQMYREIEQMAEDAGISRGLEGWELDAVADNQLFDRLLEAGGWEDAATVLDARGEAEVDYDSLLRICEARKRRGEGDSKRLEAIEKKLRATAANERRQLERRREAETRLLEGLAERIREPEGVETLIRLTVELRRLADQLERKILAAQPSGQAA